MRRTLFPGESQGLFVDRAMDEWTPAFAGEADKEKGRLLALVRPRRKDGIVCWSVLRGMS